MNDPIVVTRSLVKRGWTDFEPKVITGLLTGSLAAFVTTLLGNYGIHLSSLQQNYLVVGFYFLGAYITPSSGTTITKKVEDAAKNIITEVEQHRGATVSTVTNSIPIQTVPANPNTPDSFTDVVTGTSTADAKTEVMPPAPLTGAAAFLAARSQQNNEGH